MLFENGYYIRMAWFHGINTLEKLLYDKKQSFFTKLFKSPATFSLRVAEQRTGAVTRGGL